MVCGGVRVGLGLWLGCGVRAAVWVLTSVRTRVRVTVGAGVKGRCGITVSVRAPVQAAGMNEGHKEYYPVSVDYSEGRVSCCTKLGVCCVVNTMDVIF